MRRAGERARSFFARWCTDKMMRQRIDPAIADMQAEYGRARRDRHVWKGRWVRLAGYMALAKLAACCAGERMTAAVVEWPAVDLRQFARIVTACVVATMLMALIVIGPEAAEQKSLFAKSGYSTALFLLPYALSTAITAGLVLGIAWCRAEVSRRVRAATVVLAAVASMASVVNLGWIVPAANQAYRTRIFAVAPPSGIRGEPPRGANELTFGELATSVDYHKRLRLATAPIALVLLVLTLRARTRSRRLAAVVAGLTAWFVVLSVTARWASLTSRLPIVVLWLPNLAFVLLAVGRWRNERALTRRA